MNHDIGLSFLLGSITSHRDICDNRDRSELDYVFVTLNLVLEELDEEEDAGRNSQTEYEGDEHDDRTLRTNLAHERRSIDNLTLVGCSSQRDRVFLTLLQKHQVKTRLHLLLTANLCQYTLLLRRVANLVVVLTGLCSDAVALNLHSELSLTHGSLDRINEVVQLCCQWSYSRRVLAG